MPLMVRYEKHVKEREKGTTAGGGKQNKWVEKESNINQHLLTL